MIAATIPLARVREALLYSVTLKHAAGTQAAGLAAWARARRPRMFAMSAGRA